MTPTRDPFMLLTLLLLVSCTNSVYYSSCSQSSTRTCVYGTNVTDRLLNMKKGGSNVLSTADYDLPFFPCQQYNYNCGYQEDSNDFLTVSNGVQLNLTYSELLNCVPSDSVLTNTVKPYLGLSSSSAQCVSNVFPLNLTDTQSTTLLTGYLNRVTANLSTLYNANKATYAPTWANLNINIKTAVVEMAKYNMNNNFIGGTFWKNFLFNNWALMSTELKEQHKTSNCPQCLHSAYLIDSVTTRCNKYQSINFLVDQSGSIGSGPFVFAKSFLTAYVNQTYDDLSIMSIHFYDSSFDPWIAYGNNRATILNKIASKAYRGGGTATGLAINSSVSLIKAANYPNGVPKILVILTDGVSYDSVIQAANNARANGIILFCVGIGANVNTAQLVQIAGSTSNIVYISSYSSLTALVNLIENYFCKQIIDVNLDSFIYGNQVRVPTSPSYFRVQRSYNASQYFMLSIIYRNDPSAGGEMARESHFDPFPDAFSEFASTKAYRTGVLTKQYFIAPVSSQAIPIKKTYYLNQTPDRSFISIAGTALDFNISLTTCATPSCTEQIAAAASIGSMNPDNSDNPNSDTNIDTNIFVPIGVGVALMGLATAGVIFGLRRYAGAPQGEMLYDKPDGDNIQRPVENVEEHPDVDNEQNSHIHDGDQAKSRKSLKKKGNSQRSHQSNSSRH